MSARLFSQNAGYVASPEQKLLSICFCFEWYRESMQVCPQGQRKKNEDQQIYWMWDLHTCCSKTVYRWSRFMKKLNLAVACHLHAGKIVVIAESSPCQHLDFLVWTAINISKHLHNWISQSNMLKHYLKKYIYIKLSCGDCRLCLSTLQCVTTCPP